MLACQQSLPVVVGKVNLTAQNANIGATTLYTPTTDGFYEMSFGAEITATGTSGTIQANAIFTDDIGTVTQTVYATGYIISSGVGRAPSGSGRQSYFFKGLANQPIQYSITGISTAGALQYNLQVTLTRLN